MNTKATRPANGRLLLGTIAAVASLGLVACGSSNSSATGTSPAASHTGPATGEPIKVGVLTDMTGAFSIVGKSNKAVAQFTIDEINKNGGVLGRPRQIRQSVCRWPPSSCRRTTSRW